MTFNYNLSGQNPDRAGHIKHEWRIRFEDEYEYALDSPTPMYVEADSLQEVVEKLEEANIDFDKVIRVVRITI